MELIKIKERIGRIKYRIAKEYVFDEACLMRDDLVWTLKAIAQLEAELTIRQELEELIKDGERYEMGGPFVSVHWVLNRMDALKEVEDVQPTS